MTHQQKVVGTVFDHTDDLHDVLFDDLKVEVDHDPGYRYNANGDGCPPSTVVEVIPCERRFAMTLDADVNVGEVFRGESRVTRYNGPKCYDYHDEWDVEVTGTVRAIEVADGVKWITLDLDAIL